MLRRFFSGPTLKFSLPLLAGLTLLSPVALAVNENTVKISGNSPDFARLIENSAGSELLSSDSAWSEGPQCLTDGRLVWSDVRGNKVMSWKEGEGARVWIAKADFQNGHALDKQERLIAASHGKRGILRQEKNGEWTLLVDRYKGGKLNSPNDLTVAADGAIWFTDPTFGLKSKAEGYGGKQEQEGEYIYRFDPETKALTRMTTPEVGAPNGLAFSPDGKKLYIADSQLAHNFQDKKLNHRIAVYDVVDNQLRNGRVFADITDGIPDGLAVDALGNLWSSSKHGVLVFSAAGKQLGQLEIPAEDTSNLTFCRSGKQNWLYITASEKVFRLPTRVAGAL